jgi:hypothetical protein
MKRITKEDIAQLERDIAEMHVTLRESKLRKNSQSSTTGMTAWPALNNNNNPYYAYKFGIAMAGAPESKTDKNGPIGGDFITMSYTDGDDLIARSAAKQMGISSKAVTSKKSKEDSDVHKTSPVAAAKRNRYGI